jgi:(R,R)-butanediol dehydrogenase / meso-butanediol dehydrogenase / diacetyl reductase
VLVGLVTGQRRFELVERPEPTPSEQCAVVNVRLCGICGTDLHGFLGADPYNPAICGHEWVGVVSATGSGVIRVTAGDRVVMGTPSPCGGCAECNAGRSAYCVPAFLSMIGRDALAPPHGGFAAHVAVAATRLVPVPANVTDESAAITEPATIALHAVDKTPPRPDDVVVVQGCGPIGLLVIQCARARGVGQIVAVEPSPGRRELAVACGADRALDPGEAADEFGRRGADLVYECAGVAATVQQAVTLVRRGGRVNLVGLASGTATISPGAWLMKEVQVTASLGSLYHEFVEVLDLISDHQLPVEVIHDSTIPLAELPTAIERLADDPSSATKVLVDPTNE